MNGKYVSEQELNEKAVAPRVTLEMLEANIKNVYYFTAEEGVIGADHARNIDGDDLSQSPLALVTFCTLVLKNGYTVTGQSACASPENYDEEIGRRVARGDAVRQVWGLMGYELRSKLHTLQQISVDDSRLGEALTRMTAFGLGNKDAFSMRDADTILTHFMHDHQEEGGRTLMNEVTQEAVDYEKARNFAWDEENCTLIQRNELGSAHPDLIREPTITEDSLDQRDYGDESPEARG